MTRLARVTAAAGSAVVLATALAACGSSSADSGSSTSQSLPIGLNGSVAYSFNPYDQSSLSDLEDPAYDTLIHYVDGELKPWLATSWDFKDPTTLELKLRNGVTFTDGTTFDAEAVRANFQYAIDNKANYGSLIFLQNVSGMTVVDPTTLDVTLSTPNPALPYDLSQNAGYMVSPKALQNPDGLKQAPVGTGPYVLDTAATRAGVSYSFKRNPDYWAAKENVFPYDTVTFTLQGDPNAAKNAAASGQVKALTVQPGTTIPGFTTVTSNSGNQSGFSGAWVDVTGTALKAMGDQRVRQALNYAIDRAKIAKAVYQDAAVAVPLVPVTKDSPAWSEQLGSMYPYDPDKAKQLLAEAGYPDGFELTMISLPPADQFAQAIAGQLQQVGVKVNIESHTSDLVQAVQSGTRPTGLLLSSLTGDFGQDMANLFSSTAFYNVHQADDPQLDALLKQAAQETDENARNHLYQQAAQRGADDAWFLGTVQLQTITAFDPKVVKVEPPDRGAIHLYDYHLPS
nr:ABC transporter substrate-binding protein [Petropleomorpha daqingensis]